MAGVGSAIGLESQSSTPVHMEQSDVRTSVEVERLPVEELREAVASEEQLGWEVREVHVDGERQYLRFLIVGLFCRGVDPSATPFFWLSSPLNRSKSQSNPPSISLPLFPLPNLIPENP